MSSDIVIKVDNLSKRYNLQHPVKDEAGNDTHELWALKDVSFEIKRGESIGIIGPNGSGKSSLLKILAGVSKPTFGRVEVSGRVASILDIGAGFHPELSGRENVFLNGQILGFKKREIQAKFDEIIEFSGIEKFIDEPVKNYSNGMYLRLAFSIMTHLDFDIYLLDEVLSAGDLMFQQKCMEQIKKMISGDHTLVYVSHNLGEISTLCKKCMIIQESKLKYFGKNDVLEHYINQMTPNEQIPTPPDFIIKNDPQNTINSDLASITNIQFDADQTLEDGISSTSNIKIELKVLVKQNVNVDVGMKLNDKIKGTLFSFSTMNAMNAMNICGEYCIEFILPGNLLAGRIYTLDILIVQDRNIIQYENNEIITFKISKNNKQKLLDVAELNNIISPYIVSTVTRKYE